jgi:hypothetical protein
MRGPSLAAGLHAGWLLSGWPGLVVPAGSVPAGSGPLAAVGGRSRLVGGVGRCPLPGAGLLPPLIRSGVLPARVRARRGCRERVDLGLVVPELSVRCGFCRHHNSKIAATSRDRVVDHGGLSRSWSGVASIGAFRVQDLEISPSERPSAGEPRVGMSPDMALRRSWFGSLRARTVPSVRDLRVNRSTARELTSSRDRGAPRSDDSRGPRASAPAARASRRGLTA